MKIMILYIINSVVSIDYSISLNLQKKKITSIAVAVAERISFDGTCMTCSLSKFSDDAMTTEKEVKKRGYS